MTHTPFKPCIATIGMFDGVHVGHQHILNRLKNEARKRKLSSMVITFDRHPSSVSYGVDFPFITPPSLRRRIIASMGIDNIVTHHFSEEFAQFTAEEFLLVLRQTLKVKVLLMGFNNFIGNDHLDYKQVKPIAKELGIEVITCREVDDEYGPISSSEIRNAIFNGHVDDARIMLGTSYSIEATVVKGQQIGRQIGFPTANLKLDEPFILPANGVYFVGVQIGHEHGILYGVANIGIRPTVNDDKYADRAIEVHIFDFDRDIYGESLYVSFVERLRKEKKFESLDLLKAQIERDCKKARKILTTLYSE